MLLILVGLATGSCPDGLMVSPKRLPLRTAGDEVVDKDGCRVTFGCVNWYGAHMELYTGDGLHKQSLSTIVDQIVKLGFNCVRLPYSLELLYDDPLVPDVALAANPELQGMRGMALFDRSVKAITDAGIMVILNNHNSQSGWCCSGSSEEGLWHTSKYPMDRWLGSLEIMTKRYLDNRMVVGFDIRNEIHDVGDVKLTWGTSDDNQTDWRVASTLGARIVQTANPDILVIVTGLCFGVELRAMRKFPLEMKVTNKLVYTTHIYTWSLWWNAIKGILKLRGLDGKVGGKGVWIKARADLLIAGACMAALVCVMLTVWCWWCLKREQTLTPLTYRGLVFSCGLWITLGPGILLLIAAVSWKYATESVQCSIAPTSSNTLLAVSIPFMLLGIGIIVFAAKIWKGGERAVFCSAQTEIGEMDEEREVDRTHGPQTAEAHQRASAHSARQTPRQTPPPQSHLQPHSSLSPPSSLRVEVDLSLSRAPEAEAMSPQTLSPVHVEMKEYDVLRTGDDLSRTQGTADAAGGIRAHSRAVTRPLCLTPPQPSVQVVSRVRAHFYCYSVL